MRTKQVDKQTETGVTTQDISFPRLTIAKKEKITCDIWRFELTDPQGAPLPPFEAESNLTVVAPSGIRRSYPLCNDSQESHRYVIAIKHDSNSCGGSISLIDGTSIGDLIDISLPRNEFPLDEHTRLFIFVTGGIGIAPMLSMARQLKAEGLRGFKLYYLARNPEGTAFLNEFSNDQWRSEAKIRHNLDDPTRSFGFWTLFERPKAAHIYYCGPQMLMDTVRDMTGHWPSGTVHFENFGTNNMNAQVNTSFIARLKRTGTPLDIPADRSVLNMLRAKNVHVVSSCESDTCGSCRTVLCSDEADHRDMVLRDDEKAMQIMVCISRAGSGELVLGL